MLKCLRMKWISVTVLTFFCLFLFESTTYARSTHPRYAKIPFKVEGARIKVKNVNGKVIPLEMKIGDRTFRFTQQDGIWGIQLRNRDMVNLSRDFEDKLGTAVCQLALYRVQQLVGGDREMAQEVVDQHKRLKRASSAETGIGTRYAQALHGALSSPGVSALPRPAIRMQAGSGVLLAAAGGGQADRQFLNQMNRSYSQVLNSQSFFYPMVPEEHGLAPWDWDVISESAEGTEDDDGTTWYDYLLGLFLIAVVLIAPVAAAVWLASQALTIASVLIAFSASVGAVTAAGIIDMTLGSVLDLLHGNPLAYSYDHTTHSSETSYFTEIGPGQWNWP